MKASQTFFVRRAVDFYAGRVTDFVTVSATVSKDGRHIGGSGTLCLSQFREVFGFTPRKGKMYRVDVSSTFALIDVEAES